MSCTRPQRIKMLGKDSSHSFGMTMRVISNEVRDPSLIPFSKEHTKDTKFGKEGDLISSLTFVIFVPFVVNHCSRTLRPFDVAQGMLGRRFCLLRRFCID